MARAPLKLLLCAPLLSLVAACGGGGGGGGSGGAIAAASAPVDGPSYVVAGQVNIVDALAADIDSGDSDSSSDLRNNPDDPYQPPGEGWPQPLEENPVKVAGFVSANGDPDDYFSLELKAGQLVRLEIADPQRADLDLYLYESSGQRIIDGALSMGAREEIRVIFDREYVINVSAYSGSSAYVLSVLQPVQGASLASPTLGDDFRANELLVEMDESVEAASVRQRMEPREIRGERVQRWRMHARAVESPKRSAVEGGLQDKFDTLMQLKAVSAQHGVRRVEPNYLMRASAVPNDTHYHKQWHFPFINLPDAWDMTTGARPGRDVIVAVLDTGVIARHPDLDGQLVDGYDFVASLDAALDGDGIDPYPHDPVVHSQSGLDASTFHGTHVAGTIAAASNNGQGVAGIAWQAKVMPIRVLGEGSSGTVYDVLQGVRYAAGLPNDSGRVPAQRADIINLSLTGRVRSDLAEQAYAEARAAGVIVVAAGGNSGTSTPVYPAAYPGVIGVGAVGADKERLSYSSYGAGIDLVAPGGMDFRDDNFDGYPDVIYSTHGNLDPELKKADYNYAYKSGSSMSAAHVSGVIALMEAVDPNGDLTPSELDQLLQSGALTEDLGAPGRDDFYGYGLIDAYRAVLAAAGGVVSAPPALDAAPRSLDLGMQTGVTELTLFNAGGGELEVYSVRGSVDWIEIVAPDSDDGLGNYQLRILREQMPAGDYRASLQVESSAGAMSIEVMASQPSAGQLQGRNAGVLHVYLVEVTESGEVPRAEIVSRVDNGRYDFTIGNVSSGRNFRIRATTDHDNDGAICDAGEACASSSLIEDLSGDLRDLQLTLELR